MYKLFILISAFVCFASPDVQENLIRNGNFSDSSSAAAWSFESNGSLASGAVEMGRFAIDVRSSDNKDRRPQLVQRGIDLESYEGYILTFRASASDSSSMRVYVSGDNAVFTDSAEEIIQVSNTSKLYSLSFFTPRSNGSARVVFSCPVMANRMRYIIDSVSLVKNPVPVILVVEPSQDTRWITGTEREIKWRNSGDLERVTIRCSSDNGKTWSDIAAVAENKNSFWWQIPAAVFGDSCRIIVSDITKLIADTTAPFKIIDAGSVDSREMVKNSTFLDTTDWQLEVTPPARARGSMKNDSEYTISVDTMGDKAWQVKLHQNGLSLENGALYRFSFDAYASHDRAIYANIGADNGNPTWSVFGGDTIPVAITTTKTRYNQVFVMKYSASGNMRLEFNCGNDTGKVHIDNVSLLKLDMDEVYIFSPSAASVLRSGARFNIEWHAPEISTVDLEFSSDSGNHWSSIFEEIDNLGVVSWVVPEVSSDECFIRIKRSPYDSVLAMSSQFSVNAFGKQVKTGELMVNGTFSSDLKGWNMRFDGGEGQARISDGVFSIDITNPGEKHESIVLSQAGIPILKGKDYTLSFDAFANGTRFIEIVVIGENDSSIEMNKTYELPAISKEATFKFRANKDAFVKVEFQFGGAHAGVFIDNVSFYTGVLVNTAMPIVRARQKITPFSAVHQGRGAIAFINGGNEDGRISVFNLQGALVYTTAFSGTRMVWNRTLQSGHHAVNGSYIAQLTTPGTRQSCSFTLK